MWSFKYVIFIRGDHFDLSPRAPKILVTPQLTTIMLESIPSDMFAGPGDVLHKGCRANILMTEVPCAMEDYPLTPICVPAPLPRF
jgi:hypothetical protein